MYHLLFQSGKVGYGRSSQQLGHMEIKPTLLLYGAVALVTIFPLNAASADDVADTIADPRNYADAPHSGLKLGHGISPDNVAVAKFPCLTFTEERLDPAAADSTVTTSYVSNSDQMDSALGVDVKAQASGWGATADFSLSRKLSIKFTSDSAILLVTASSNFGRWGLKSNPAPALSDYATLLRSNSLQFADKCGSRYVNMEWRGASVTAVITISHISSDLRQSLNLAVGASGGYGAVSGSLRASLSSELTKANSQGRVATAVYAKGGMGVEGLGDLVTASVSSANPLDDIAKTLANYIKSIHADNAFPIAYQVRSMSDFGWNPVDALLWDDSKERRTRELFKAAARVEADRISLENLISTNSPWLPYTEHIFGTGYAHSELEQLQRSLAILRSDYEVCVLGKPGMMGCDDHYEGFSSRIVAIAEASPSAIFVVQRNLPSSGPISLPPDASRVVLSGPEAQRVTIAGQFDPQMASQDATGADPKLLAALVFRGDGLASQQIVFIDEKGAETVVYPETAPIQVTWYSGYDNTAGNTLEGGIHNFMNAWTGSHVGTFAVRIRDIAGHNTIIPLVDATWTSTGTASSIEQWKALPS